MIDYFTQWKWVYPVKMEQILVVALRNCLIPYAYPKKEQVY